MMKMLELICRIPDHIGWMMVGALGACCGWVLADLIKIGVQMWKDRREDKEDTENDD